MKFSYFVAVLALFGVASTNALQLKNKLSKAGVEKEFSNFVSKFGRNYKSSEEYNTRLGNFAKNYQRVADHNGKHNFTLSLNKFADLSDAEYKSMLNPKLNEEHQRMSAT